MGTVDASRGDFSSLHAYHNHVVAQQYGARYVQRALDVAEAVGASYVAHLREWRVGGLNACKEGRKVELGGERYMLERLLSVRDGEHEPVADPNGRPKRFARWAQVHGRRMQDPACELEEAKNE